MELKTILDKLENTPLLKVKKVALAFSGGLDSSLCVELLRKIYHAEEIVAITVNIGQGADELKQLEATALALNIKPVVIDATKEFSQQWLTKAIRANSSYNGYPVSTSMTRQLVARIVAMYAKEHGCDAVMEGSTGKGNDQFRMNNTFKLFAPDLEVLVPVRDFNLSRSEETTLCKAWGIPVIEQICGGDDKTMWCRSIASGAIGLHQELPDNIWMWYKSPQQAPDQAVTLKILFKKGLPVAIDDQALSLDAIVEHLNTLGGMHGIGKIDLCEDGIIGLKSREIYEAPAAQILLKIHGDLEQFCLTKEEIQFKKMVDTQWAHAVYHGMWHHPLKNALDMFIETTQSNVNGLYTIKLYKGTIEIIKRDAMTSLFNPEFRSINASKIDQRWCAAKMLGVPYEILALRSANMKKE